MDVRALQESAVHGQQGPKRLPSLEPAYHGSLPTLPHSPEVGFRCNGMLSERVIDEISVTFTPGSIRVYAVPLCSLGDSK